MLFNARSSRTARGAGRLERTLRGEIEARVVLAARHLHQAHQGVEEVVVREVAARRQALKAFWVELEGDCGLLW